MDIKSAEETMSKIEASLSNRSSVNKAKQKHRKPTSMMTTQNLSANPSTASPSVDKP